MVLSQPGGVRPAAPGDKEPADAIVEELLRYLSPVQVAFPGFAAGTTTSSVSS